MLVHHTTLQYSYGSSIDNNTGTNINESTLVDSMTVCEGTFPMLTASDNAQLDYFWFPANYFDDPFAMNPSIIVEETGYYGVRLTNGSIVTEDSVYINFLDTFHIDIPEEIHACKNELFNIDLDPQFSYNWFPVFNNMCLNDNCSQVELSLTFDQEFLVVVTNDNVCQDSFIISIIIDGQSETYFQRDTVCQGEQVLFNGVLYSESGIYCDTLLNDTICPQIQCLDLFVNKVDDIINTIEICEGEEYEFQNTIYTESIFICTDGINNIGCDSTYCLDLIVNKKPEINISEYGDLGAEGSIVEIKECNNYPLYTWFGNIDLDCKTCSSISFSMEQDVELELHVTDEYGCSNSEIISIGFIENCRLENLLLPDAITPNNNDRNDRFRIVNFRDEANEVRIKIFNRWGELLYQENGNIGWDGYYKNEIVPEGVYLYLIEVTCEDNSTVLFKGDLTVLR